MNVLSIQNIAKTVDDRPLFSEVTLGLDAGEKVGIVGRNGAGKTTFLKQWPADPTWSHWSRM